MKKKMIIKIQLILPIRFNQSKFISVVIVNLLIRISKKQEK